MPLQFGATLPDHPTDTELLARCRQGQVQAFERLYRMYAPRMKSLAFHLLGNEGDAEDAVQETFFKVFKGAKGFHENSALSTWIYRILINSCHDVMRKRHRLAEKPLLNEISSNSNLGLKIALQRALLTLNERHRLVFLMFEVEGLKHSEISGVLEVPEGTSRAWLFEAKRLLKEKLMEFSR